jgi:hypothetical protein
MRVLLAIAVLSFGIAGGAARAADLQAGHPGIYSARDFVYAQRSEMLWIDDDQPGVGVRAYWRAPWRHHHYFPATGILPRIGRNENLSAVSRPPKPAKTFRRSWSNAAALELEQSAGVQPLGSEPDSQPNTRSGTRHRPHVRGSHRIHKR